MVKELNNEELEKIFGGDDEPEIRFKGKEVPLPGAKSKKQVYDLEDGDYTNCSYYKVATERKQACTYKALCRNQKCIIK